jgi:4-hydroxybenzoate polyprenyltransferase
MLKRISIYLKEMFPLSSFIGSILTAIAVQLIYLRLFEIKNPPLIPLVLPGLVLTSISLLIRIMDEFKDYQDDLTNFPNRPLPSGRVFKKDLLWLAGFCIFIVLFLSLTSLKLVLWSFITLGFTFLMLKWFFIENVMRKSLPLAFLSHHPIVLFNFTYLLIACSEVDPRVDLSKVFYILPICLIFTNWELTRKIRAPEQETAYTTYSKIWGPRFAISITIVIQLVFTSTVFLILKKLESHFWILCFFAITQLFLIFPSLKFLVTLKMPRPLKNSSEAQILVIVMTLLTAALL